MMKSLVAAGLVFTFATGAALAQSGPQSEDIRAACKSDVERLCSDVEPIEVPMCLEEHIDEVSAGCKETVQSVRQQDQDSHD
ncbi:hypothetical protein [Amorphus sp. 3PC139-8]|uniref:hypothetical protein n=1 Tax=Amorphus sp. 3PC139-8 TaxID=2735676 RepID=UPI00345D8129